MVLYICKCTIENDIKWMRTRSHVSVCALALDQAIVICLLRRTVCNLERDRPDVHCSKSIMQFAKINKARN